MRGVRAGLIVPLDSVDVDHLLESWTRLLPASLAPLIATALGDLFLRGFALPSLPVGSILWIDDENEIHPLGWPSPVVERRR